MTIEREREHEYEYETTIERERERDVNTIQRNRQHIRNHDQDIQPDTDQEAVSYVRADEGGEEADSESEGEGLYHEPAEQVESRLYSIIEWYKNYTSLLKEMLFNEGSSTYYTYEEDE